MIFFLKDVVIVAILVVIINVPIYFGITYNILYEPYEEELNNVDVIKNANFFIFSDSHGWSITNGNPEIKDELYSKGVWNFAYGSDSYADMRIKLEWLIEKKVIIDTIFISVDDHMFSKVGNNWNRSFVYSSYSNFKSVHQSNGLKYIYYFFAKYLPVIYPSNQRLIKEFMNSIFIKSDTEEKDHLTWENNSQEMRRLEIERRMQSFFKGMKYKTNANPLYNFRKFISLAKEKGITTIGVKFPIDENMLEKIDEIGAKDIVVKEALDMGIDTVLDFSSINKLNYLANQDHVNSEGAAIISNELLKSIK